jgi:hypothetical protein
MRFPSRLLAANMWFALIVWAGFLAAVAAVGATIAIVGTLTYSIWEMAAQVPRWYALFVGVALVREFLPLYVAHGQTRRQFGGHAAITATLFAPFVAALIVIGYLIEAGIYRLAGLEQAIQHAHLFTAPTQVPLVFAEYALETLTWIVVGAFLGAAFYRLEGGGFLAIPVGIALVLLAESAIGSEVQLPFLWDNAGPVGAAIGYSLPQSPAMAVAVVVGTYLIGLALTWSLIRDVPLRNKWS